MLGEIKYLYVPIEDYGKLRRKYIIDWFNTNPNGQYAVNCKHRPQIKDDPDLKRLIKTGFLKAIRQSTGSKSRRTYLVKV